MKEQFKILKLIMKGRRGQPKDYESWPQAWKERVYTTYERTSERVLPNNAPSEALTQLNVLLDSRFSAETFPEVDVDIDVNEISEILKRTVGMNTKGRRLTPSGGAFYPVETYFLYKTKGAVKLYHYNFVDEYLEHVKTITMSKALSLDEYKEFFSTNAQGMFIFTVSLKRSFSKYGMLAVRLAFIEVGILAHTITLGMIASKGYISKLYNTYKEEDLDTIIQLDGISEHGALVLLLSRTKVV